MTEADQDEKNCLFHCSNLQGVILGVGLAMVEHRFIDEKQEKTPQKAAKSATGKRRKATTNVASAPYDLDEDGLPIVGGGNGKKAKLGIGYAGDIKEDVGPIW